MLGIAAGVLLVGESRARPHLHSRSPATVLIQKLAEAREAIPRPVYVGPWLSPFTTALDDVRGYSLCPLVAHCLWAPARPAQEDVSAAGGVRVEEFERPETAV